MTPRQRDVLDFMARYIADRGFSPSYEEIAAALGLASKSGAYRMVIGLIQRGYLKREHTLGCSRNLVLADSPSLALVPTATLIEELNRRGAKDRHDA